MDLFQETDRIIRYFPGRLQEGLRRIPNFIRCQLQEIRVRIGCPIMLCTGRENLLLSQEGQVFREMTSVLGGVTKEEITHIFEAICQYSVHSHQEELKNGFLTLKGGHRVGVSGTFLSENGNILGIKEITSLNIRLAREVTGAADELLSLIGREDPASFLLVGAPATGKTTLLRDFARQVSNGVGGRLQKVALIDERGELAAGGRSFDREGQADVGISTDVYSFCPKTKGMEMALRTGSPDFLICDELGSGEEADLLLEALSSGVKAAVSVHGDHFSDLMQKRAVKRLIEAGVFQKIVFLEKKGVPGTIKEVITISPKGCEEKNESIISGHIDDISVQLCRYPKKSAVKGENSVIGKNLTFDRKNKNSPYL